MMDQNIRNLNLQKAAFPVIVSQAGNPGNLGDHTLQWSVGFPVQDFCRDSGCILVPTGFHLYFPKPLSESGPENFISFWIDPKDPELEADPSRFQGFQKAGEVNMVAQPSDTCFAYHVATFPDSWIPNTVDEPVFTQFIVQIQYVPTTNLDTVPVPTVGGLVTDLIAKGGNGDGSVLRRR